MISQPPTTSSEDQAAVEIRDLRVDYGEFVAVHDLSLSIPRGEVFGIVGPNGAGKTSTFKVLATLMEPTYGEVRLHGLDIMEETQAARRIMGYMPDLAPVPSDLKVIEFLRFYAHAHALGDEKTRHSRVEECLAMVDLVDKRDAWCKKLSRGQTQRLVLAKTLLHRPQVLILDEPASGLDPLARRDLRHILQKLAHGGVTVLVSSHILSELAEMCSSLCIMNEGKLLASGTAEEIRREMGRAERKLSLVVLGDTVEAAERLTQRGGVSEVKANGERVDFCFEGSEVEQADLLAGLVQQGVVVKLFEEKESSFEDILMEVAEGNRES